LFVGWGKAVNKTKSKMKLPKFTKLTLGALLLLGALTQVQADDKKADPSGTYVWNMPGRNGSPDRTNTLVLKVAGDKVTGTISMPGRNSQATTTDIADGKLSGADVSFAVVRTFNGNTFTNKYSGTVADGAIKGKVEMMRNGEPQTRDWEAKLQK
jgi:hypothetical protein